MLDNQQKKKAPKQPKNPKQDWLNSIYRFAGTNQNVTEPLDSHGTPAMAFKSATVKGGGRAFGKAAPMTELRQALVFLTDGASDDGQQLTRLLINEEPSMREDMVKIPGTADIRYRAEYKQWGAVLRVQFMPNVIDIGSVVALIDAGGANGVGEWRPEKSGSFGTFQVVGEDIL